VAYTVPKAALNAFSRQLALQLGAAGIRVNTVFPGPIASERIAACSPRWTSCAA
jgi:malonyl-CoA reductase / 3-hydroxypropionate dehydrogenase (NADP+)